MLFIRYGTGILQPPEIISSVLPTYGHCVNCSQGRRSGNTVFV